MDKKPFCDNQRVIRLTNIESKILVSIIQGLYGARENQIREIQAAFRPGHVRTD